jgi:hypothetical protein
LSYNDYDEFDRRQSRSGRVTTKDEAMGLLGGKRVSHVNRDDVTHHIAACVTHGYLDDEEAAARMDAAGQARTEGDLIHIVKDLPGEDALAVAGARKRLARRAGGRFGRLFHWLLATKAGRAAFHGAVAALALMLAIITPTAINVASHGHFGIIGGGLAIAAVVVGVITLIVNMAFCIDWYADHS